MKKYQCYEENCSGIYTESELQELYDKTIDKGNFENFDCWLEEMTSYLILVAVEQNQIYPIDK